MKGEPLHSLGLAKSVGFALLFEGPSPSGSYVRPVPLERFHRRTEDSHSARTVFAWVQGVLALRPNREVNLPKYVRAELVKRKRGWYTLNAYTSLKVARYLVSLDVKRLADYQSVWCCRYNQLTKRPSIEFSNMVRSFEGIPERPYVAKSKQVKPVRIPQEYLDNPDLLEDIPVLSEAEFLAQQEAWAGGTDSEEESEED